MGLDTDTNYTTHPCVDKSECLGSALSDDDDDGVMRSGVIHLARRSRPEDCWNALLADHNLSSVQIFSLCKGEKNSKRTSAPVPRNPLCLAVCHDVQQKKVPGRTRTRLSWDSFLSSGSGS